MNNVQAPVRTTTPTIAPAPEPLRRLTPDRTCPTQKIGVVRTVRRNI